MRAKNHTRIGEKLPLIPRKARKEPESVITGRKRANGGEKEIVMKV